MYSVHVPVYLYMYIYIYIYLYSYVCVYVCVCVVDLYRSLFINIHVCSYRMLHTYVAQVSNNDGETPGGGQQTEKIHKKCTLQRWRWALQWLHSNAQLKGMFSSFQTGNMSGAISTSRKSKDHDHFWLVHNKESFASWLVVFHLYRRTNT